jgi:hypothetical protein
MGRFVDEGKKDEWRKRLARFARGGQTVAAFCLGERVSMATFYHWKRRLASESVERRTGATAVGVSRNGTGAFLPVRIERAAAVEIELPNGTRVRVPVGDHDALAAAIAAAGRVPAHTEVETPRC